MTMAHNRRKWWGVMGSLALGLIGIGVGAMSLVVGFVLTHEGFLWWGTWEMTAGVMLLIAGLLAESILRTRH